MIFLRPNNIFEFLFQSLVNTIFRFRQSIKKRLVQEVENNIFISGEFFEKISRGNSSMVFSSLDNFPLKKNYSRYKKKIWIFHNSDETFDIKALKRISYFKPLRCYSQNLVINKKGFYFLPIGLENNKYQNHGDINDFKTELIKFDPKRIFSNRISETLLGL